jgi:hypothetical protein
MKAAPLEDYEHLLFTGEVPPGFKLEEDFSYLDYMWVIKKGGIVDQVVRNFFWVCLLDTGHLCFASNGYGYSAYRAGLPMAGYHKFIGKGRCHYKVIKVGQ